AFRVLNDLGGFTFHHGDARIGRAEVDANDLSHLNFIPFLAGRPGPCGTRTKRHAGLILPWIAPGPTPHHSRRPRRGSKTSYRRPPLDRKPRLAASASINARKALRPPAPARRAGPPRWRPRARSALRGTDRTTTRTFTVLPDGGLMDLTLR